MGKEEALLSGGRKGGASGGGGRDGLPSYIDMEEGGCLLAPPNIYNIYMESLI